VQGDSRVRLLHLEGLGGGSGAVREKERGRAARVEVHLPEGELPRPLGEGEALLLHHDDKARHPQGIDLGAEGGGLLRRHPQLLRHARQGQGHIVPLQHEFHHRLGS